MLFPDLLTLRPASRIGTSPASIPVIGTALYQARFLSSGPDVAVEITHEDVRTYIEGELRNDKNRFSDYIANYRRHLLAFWSDVTKKSETKVILVGRWHRPEDSEGMFDAAVIYIIGEDGFFERPYDIECFDHDYHQSAMSIEVTRQIDHHLVNCLKGLTAKLVAPVLHDQTVFGVPHCDGVVWVPNNKLLPTVICNVDWPAGTSRENLKRTLV